MGTPLGVTDPALAVVLPQPDLVTASDQFFLDLQSGVLQQMYTLKLALHGHLNASSFEHLNVG